MADVKAEVAAFLAKCDDLIQSKFILADAKISELLKCISVSPDLALLIRQATEDFSYSGAKEIYFAASPYDTVQKKVFLLPEDIYEQIAFIFCLLVDFDSGRMDLNRFLQEFFYADGSYTESYTMFVNKVIKPFKNAVRQAFKDKNIDVASPSAERNERGARLKELRATVVRLRKSLSKFVEDADSRAGMAAILHAMCDMLAQEEYRTFKALLIGYTFAENYVGIDTDDLHKICSLITELKL